jgi:hypothetical protein
LDQQLQSHKARLDQELEEFKIKAQANADARLEVAKATMARDAFEHQVRFTRLHEKRGEVLAGIYERLERLHRELRSLSATVHMFVVHKDVGGITPEELEEHEDDHLEKSKRLLQARDELDAFFHEHAIWVDARTERVIEAVLQTMLIAEVHASSLAGTDLEEAEKASEDVAKAMESVPPALNLLREHFRQLLLGEARTSREADRLDPNGAP